MKSIEIRASLPFSWCRFCYRMELELRECIVEGPMEKSVNVCRNASICQASELARVSEKLEKEDPFAKACTEIGMNQGAERKEAARDERSKAANYSRNHRWESEILSNSG